MRTLTASLALLCSLGHVSALRQGAPNIQAKNHYLAQEKEDLNTELPLELPQSKQADNGVEYERPDYDFVDDEAEEEEEETQDGQEEEGEGEEEDPNQPNEEDADLQPVSDPDSDNDNSGSKRDERIGRDNDDQGVIVPDSTIKKQSKGVVHYLIAGDKFGNVIAYDPVQNTPIVPLIATGKAIQSIVEGNNFLFVSYYDKLVEKSFIDQYPIFVNITENGMPDFQIYRDQVVTIYEGKNVTSLAVDTVSQVLYAADESDHSIQSLNYNAEYLEEKQLKAPEINPLYYGIANLNSIDLFNGSIYWTSDGPKKTLTRGNLDGWVNSTQVVVTNGLASRFTIDQDEAWYLDQSGSLMMVDLDPNDTLKNSGYDYDMPEVGMDDYNKLKKLRKFLSQTMQETTPAANDTKPAGNSTDPVQDNKNSTEPVVDPSADEKEKEAEEEHDEEANRVPEDERHEEQPEEDPANRDGETPTPNPAPRVIDQGPILPDLNMTQSVVIHSDDEQVRLFAVLDDAIFYLQEDEEDFFVKLPSIQAKSGYREPIVIDLSETELQAEDITALYIMRTGASVLLTGVVAVLSLFTLF